jgi:hypothetical protein
MKSHKLANGLVLVLDNGNRIVTYGDKYLYGSEVTVFNKAGTEAGHWVNDEWRDDPEAVMGAILACALTGKKK